MSTPENPKPVQTITITPKSSHEYLLGFDFHSSDRTRLANEILLNAREVAPSVNWEIVLAHISIISESKRYYGHGSVRKVISRNLGIAARQVGWSMDSPEVVYAGTAGLCRLLDRRLSEIVSWIEKMQSGKSEIFDQEAADRALADRVKTVSIINPMFQRIVHDLNQYALQELPDDPTRLDVLTKLPFLRLASIHTRLFKKIAQGEWEASLALLE